MKKAHLRRRLSSEGASTAPFRTSPKIAPAKPALESPPCIWTFLISLHSERLFFSTLLALGGTGS